MRQPGRLLLCLLALVAAPAVLSAKTPLHRGHGGSLHRSAIARTGRAGPGLVRPDLGPVAEQASAARAEPEGLASPSPASDYPKTAVDYRLAPHGVVGSVGYLCDPFNPSIEGREEIMAASSRFGRPSSFLGAKLSYGFR